MSAPDPLAPLGMVEHYVVRFKMVGLMHLLQRLGLWGNDTVHGMRGAK